MKRIQEFIYSKNRGSSSKNVITTMAKAQIGSDVMFDNASSITAMEMK